MPRKRAVGWQLYHIVKAERSIFFFPAGFMTQFLFIFSAMLQEVSFWGMELQFVFPKSQGLRSPRCHMCCVGWRERNDPGRSPHLPLVSWQRLLEMKHRSEPKHCAFTLEWPICFAKPQDQIFSNGANCSRLIRSGATETSIRWGHVLLSLILVRFHLPLLFILKWECHQNFSTLS